MQKNSIVSPVNADDIDQAKFNDQIDREGRRALLPRNTRQT